MKVCFGILLGVMLLVGFAPKNTVERYLFIGHGRSDGDSLHPKLAAIKFENYERLWLGGDVTAEGGLEKRHWLELDALVGLMDPSVQFALGNHDIRNGNIEWYRELTGRKSYNYHEKNRVISLCLNSQLNPSKCEDLNNQFDMIANIADTISYNKHMFLFFHSGLWGSPDPTFPSITTYSHTNFKFWSANCESSNSTFMNAIYPILAGLVEKGVSVYCILGDTGAHSKKFYQQSDKGVHFFASGVAKMDEEKNNVLVFDYDVQADIMRWKFEDVDSLLSVQ